MRGKILLAYPPMQINVDLGGGIRFARAAVPPLGLLYLATPLLQAGYEVQFVDFAAEPYSRARLHELLEGTDAVGISVLTYDRLPAQTVIDDVREVAPSIAIIVGGIDLTIDPRLPEKVDVAVVGEADHSIVQIMDSLLSGNGLARCPGVFFRDRETGQIRQGEPGTVPMNLDALGLPARHLIDRSKYTFLGKGQAGRIAAIITSRGCPFRCSYCVQKALARYRYRERSPENVLAEIQKIHDDGYRFLFVVDNDFFVNRQRVHAIMDGILERGLDLRIGVQGRVDLVDEALMKKMSEAGVRILTCGFESGCQDVLDFYQKGTTVEQNLRIIELADKYGIYTYGNFILGSPVETYEHLQETTRFVMSAPLDAVKFNSLWYIYGASLWDQAHDAGLIQRHELCVLATRERGLGRFTEQEILDYSFEANRRFYKRPAYWIRQFLKAIRVALKDPFFIKVLLLAACRRALLSWDSGLWYTVPLRG